MASMIDSFQVSNFRCFLEPTKIEVRPLTLLFGYNNSGKSALARVPPLLADSVGRDLAGPINLKSLAARGAAFSDLASKLGNRFFFNLAVGWSPPLFGSIRSAEFRVRDLPDLRQQIVEKLVLRTPDDQLLLQAEWIPQTLSTTVAGNLYKLQFKGPRPEPLELNFNGLEPVPHGEGQAQEHLKWVARDFRHLLNQVQWLTSLRKAPKRFDLLRGGPPRVIDPEGENTAQVLAYDSTLRQAEILSAVSGWYEEHFGRTIEVQREGVEDQFSLSMTPASKSEVRVNLADTGEGIAQVLPVLVALERARKWEEGYPGLLVVEQPELHLHPQAQRALASRFGQVAGGANPPQIIVETHSEQFLLAIQLAIIRGEVPLERVRVYWIRQSEIGESRAEVMPLDKEGRLPYSWPQMAFREDVEAAREVVRERLVREVE